MRELVYQDQMEIKMILKGKVEIEKRNGNWK